MKFKKLLIESVIDNLDLPKFDKGILKLYNAITDDKNYIRNYRTGDIINSYDTLDGQKIVKAAKNLSYYNYDHLIKVYKFFQKYKDILFSDINLLSSLEGSEFNYETDRNIMQPILLTYYYDNYFGNSFNISGIEWNFNMALGVGVEESIIEEVDSIVIYSVNDNVPFTNVYVAILPNKTSKFGADMITHEEAFAEWNGKIYHNTKYDEVIGGEYLTVTPLKDLKEESLKKFFDELFERVKTDLIGKGINKIEEYMEWVESSQPPQ